MELIMRSYLLPAVVAFCLLSAAGSAFAAGACPSAGVVKHLNVHGDGFLSVLAAPGDRPPYVEISRLHLGDTVSVCDQHGAWLNVLFDDSGRRGWVHQNYIQVHPLPNASTVARPAASAPAPAEAASPDQYTFSGGGPTRDNFCTVPQNAKVLLEAVERSLRKLRPSLSDFDVVDAERLAPLRPGATPQDYSCHGTFLLSNGTKVGATVSEHANVAGEQVTQVAIDPGT